MPACSSMRFGSEEIGRAQSGRNLPVRGSDMASTSKRIYVLVREITFERLSALLAYYLLHTSYCIIQM